MSQMTDQPPLRVGTLSGQITRPGHEDLARRLADFLQRDRGALAAWVGADLAATLSGDPSRCRGLLDRDIARLDGLIGAQLDAILHHPRLQRLEGSWRGLAWMVEGFDAGARLKTRLLSVSWHEIETDAARASEFDQSALFRLIYENEFGMAGGEPFGLLVMDHEVRHRPEQRGLADAAPADDISALAALAAVAAAAFAPVVVAASPALLGVDRFEDLALSYEVAAPLADAEHARWRDLAARDDARFVCVTLPRVLARPPWTYDPARPDRLFYEEYAPSARHRVWTVACYAFAAAVGRAQATFNWPADVRGVATDRVGGGLALDLPQEPFVLGAVTEWPRPPLELVLTDSQERDLVMGGLMPLNALPYGEAAFASVHSLQSLPPDAAGRGPTPAAANARLSAQISTMLCVSRFAHTLKVMGRELTGSFQTAPEIERRLQRWLSDYTNANQNADPDARARHPLISSRVEVHELRERPGAFGCVIHLQPFYQLDDVSASIRLVTGFGARLDSGLNPIETRI